MNNKQLQVVASCISRIHHDVHMSRFQRRYGLRILQSIAHKYNNLPIERDSVREYLKVAERRRLSQLIKSVVA
jgi:hypothetical protein